MADEQSPDGKKKTNPAVIIGPAVAIGAALFAVFISTSNKDKTSAPPATQEAAQPQAAWAIQALCRSQRAPLKSR